MYTGNKATRASEVSFLR